MGGRYSTTQRPKDAEQLFVREEDILRSKSINYASSCNSQCHIVSSDEKIAQVTHLNFTITWVLIPFLLLDVSPFLQLLRYGGYRPRQERRISRVHPPHQV